MKQIILVPIYFFFKYLVWIVLKIYHPFTAVIGRQNLRQNGPLIVISNHPNTLLDPLHVAIRLPRYVHFLANASLFKNPIVGWILNQLYCIPVQRTQDTNGKPLDNQSAFERSNNFLSKGGCLYVAPEGTSWMEKRLHPLKTGTARIALNFENDKSFRAGLKILPVGLVYDQPNLFGSKVQMTVGTPIEVSTYQEQYLSDPPETVRQLTEDLEIALKNMIIHTDSEDVFNTIQEIYYFHSSESYPVRVRHSQHIARKILTWSNTNSEKIEQLQLFTTKIKSILRENHLNLNTQAKIDLHGIWLLLLLACLPIFVVGLVFNWFIAAFPLMLRKWLQPVVEYHSTFNILGGLVALIVVYPFNIYVFEKICGLHLSLWSWWIMICCMLLTGIASKNWELQMIKQIRHRKWRIFVRSYPETAAEAQKIMRKILDLFA